MKLLLIICSHMVLITSCGQKSFPEYAAEPAEVQREERQGYYQVSLSGLNQAVAGTVKGVGYLHTKENQFYTRVELHSQNFGLTHRQAIHLGGKCPNGNSDVNKDGIIDFDETIQTAGKILIPLDSDIESQALGNEYPFIKEDGMYQYSEATPLDRMMDDLFEEDIDPEDNVGKLNRNENLELEARTVIVYGIPETKILPDSVTSNGQEPHDHWIPIACGIIFEGKELDESLL
ncbi:MAG TPA: hypothetical protein VNJ01_07600 [Bacteriovoracaceae bacterium]|nr:hypothetical protein [Bacteriovoracaceae bacterium]